MNPSKPCAETVAVKGDRIIKVVQTRRSASLLEKSQSHPLERKMVDPGFIDTHVHVTDFGRLLTWIDLSDINSIG